MEAINLENVRLLKNRVLIRLDRSHRTFGNGRYLIAEAPMIDGHNKIYPQIGEVILIGADIDIRGKRLRDEYSVSVGDRVICTKYNGVHVKGLPDDVIAIYDHFILAIVNEDADLVVEWGQKW